MLSEIQVKYMYHHHHHHHHHNHVVCLTIGSYPLHSKGLDNVLSSDHSFN
jgi:hypothetical protein